MKAVTSHLLALTTTTDEITGQVQPLFSFPIQVCSAVESEPAIFDIAAPSGSPRKQRWLDEGSGELVEDADCQHGVRVGDVFYPVADSDIQEINEQTKLPTMIVVGSVPVADLPVDRIKARHYLQSPPKGGSPTAYKLVYEALLEVPKGKNKRPAMALIAKRTARSRQKLCAIIAKAAENGDPHGGYLMLLELTFAQQLREPDEAVLAPQLALVKPEQVAKARQVIDQLGDGLLALEHEQDDAIKLRERLIERAIAGEPLTVPTITAPIPSTANTDDLELLLEKSLARV